MIDDRTRLKFAIELFQESVDIDPEVRSGIPVLKGTRITVGQLIAEIADDQKISEVADDWDIDPDSLRKLFDALAIYFDLSVRSTTPSSCSRQHKESLS